MQRVVALLKASPVKYWTGQCADKERRPDSESHGKGRAELCVLIFLALHCDTPCGAMWFCYLNNCTFGIIWMIGFGAFVFTNIWTAVSQLASCSQARVVYVGVWSVPVKQGKWCLEDDRDGFISWVFYRLQEKILKLSFYACVELEACPRCISAYPP